MKKATIALLLTASAAWQAHGIEKSFIFNPTKLTGFAGNGSACSETLYEPFTDPLYLDSKYDQSDSTKSTYTTNETLTSSEAKAQINGFAKALANQVDTALTTLSTDERTDMINCIHEGLLSWAQADALINVDASKTGVAYRKWFLSSITSSILKLEAAFDDAVISKDLLRWVARMAEEVHDDYKYRLETRHDLINNHDYWAAHALMNSAILTGDYSKMLYVERLFRFAMNEVSGKRNSGYFDNELARGDLAEDYMSFAVAPLMFIGEFLYANGVNLDDEMVDLKSLASFNLDLAVDKKKAQNLVEGGQKTFSKNKLIWTLPYINLFGVNDNIGKKFIREEMVYTDYFLFGGDLKQFYPHEQWIEENYKGIHVNGKNNAPKESLVFEAQRATAELNNVAITGIDFYEKARSQIHGTILINNLAMPVANPEDTAHDCALWTSSDMIFEAAKLALQEGLDVSVSYKGDLFENDICQIATLTIR